MNTPAAPAGWYRDPSDTSRDRWWDGTTWHDQWRPIDAPTPPPPPPSPAPSHPPGWYPDANGDNRYWDGWQWTQHVAPHATPLTARPAALWLALAGAAVMIVGGLGPWATALRVVDVSGTHGGDGWLVVIAGALAAVVLLGSRGKAGGVVGLLAALAGVAVGAIDLNDIQSRGAFIQAAWGIYTVIAGGVLLGITSLGLLTRRG